MTAQPAMSAVLEMLRLQKAKRDELVANGICPDCDGEGVQGGQFCGGEWTCETCKGNGLAQPGAQDKKAA